MATPAQIDYEFYETPPFVTEWLCDHVRFQGTVVDPCVGAGAMTRVIGARYPEVAFITNDLDPQWDAMAHEDASDPRYWRQFLPGMVDWVAVNPAFSIAAPILQHAWPVVTSGIAMHVRLSFLEPLKGGLRRALLRDLPPTQNLVLPRIRYRLNSRGEPSTDSVTCGWLIWHKRCGVWDGLDPIIFAPDSVIDASSLWRPTQ